MCEICGTKNDVLALCGFNVCSHCINRELGKSVEEFRTQDWENYATDRSRLVKLTVVGK